MVVGKSIPRVDAFDKVTGNAKYTDDYFLPNTLIAKVVRSTIANGLVKSFDLEEAKKVEGVIKIITCFDVPDIEFPTAGHPWSTDPSHQDISDRKLLNTRVRIYGDDIAVVIAKDLIAANRAADLIKVDYDEYEVVLTPEEAMKEGVRAIHDNKPDNIVVKSSFHLEEGDFKGSFEESIKEEGLECFKSHYQSSTVQHCHIEGVISQAYMEGGRIVVISSTQIPHIARRVIGQALGIGWGKVKVIKPYIGGGFGNKQDVLYEPLVAYLTTQVNGRPVKLDLTREEIFACTRVRHAIGVDLETWYRKDGRIVSRKYRGLSNQGGYASHAHAVTANCANVYRMLYQGEKVLDSESYTVYTNIATAGAMRGYGTPQGVFASECHLDDIARKLDMDPIEIRKINMMKEGYVDPLTTIACHSYGLEKAIDRGAELVDWYRKREEYKNDKGPIRRAVGMGILCYKTGVHPISLETASARMILNQDGSCQLQVGATEIGQGADTAFTQMASEVTGISYKNVHLISTQDTDVTPYDSGAYASRQTYVSGKAVKKVATDFKEEILKYATTMIDESLDNIDIENDWIVNINSREKIISLADVAIESFYSLNNSKHIMSQGTNQCFDNSYSFGVTFVDLEVDIMYGKVNIKQLVNVHDSGKLINPQLAEAQVHGGISMGLGYALSEELKYNAKGKPLNNNLLDYKLPTSMDHYDVVVDFIETNDKSGPFGNKSLGEPPTLTQAPAIRNAILFATGVGINRLPLKPQTLFEEFTKAGLIDELRSKKLQGGI